jgi:hypothetical protein
MLCEKKRASIHAALDVQTVVVQPDKSLSGHGSRREVRQVAGLGSGAWCAAPASVQWPGLLVSKRRTG